MYTKKRLVMRLLAGVRACFVLAMLAQLGIAVLEMLVPQLIRVTVDVFLGGEEAALPGFMRGLSQERFLWVPALLMVGVGLLQMIFRRLSIDMVSQVSQGLVKTARNLVYGHLLSVPLSWHGENQTGDLLQRVTTDVSTVQEFLSEQVLVVLQIVMGIVLSMGSMVLMNGKLSLVAFIGIPVLLGGSLLFYRKVGPFFQECDENEGLLSSVAQENLTGVRVVRAFGRESMERDRFRKMNGIYTDRWMDLCRLLAVYWFVGDGYTEVQMLLVVVLGTVLCVRGEITPGMLLAFVSYNRQLTQPLRRLGRILSDMSRASVSMDRLLYILNAPKESWPGKEEPDLSGDICFDHVSFSYGEKAAVEDISFTVKGGTTLGILGTTGSGKSTLMSLLEGLYVPREGTVSIGGVPLSSISLPYLRSQVGLVMQEPFLFSRTVRENIAMARDLSKEEMDRVLEVSALTETMRTFLKGLDTMVGERGVTLSGGQKQRVAIARMLAQDAPILVLDDSLSAVDAGTDERIRRELSKETRGKTVILISHRIASLMGADQILVMQEGRIVQRGTHEELLKEEGLYRRIYTLQNLSEGGDAA